MEGKIYEDPNRLGLIQYLKQEGQKQPIWSSLAEALSASRKNRSEVNLDKINKLTKAKDTVVVAGKVLANGSLDHDVTIACFKISEPAKAKIEQAKGSVITIKELVAKNPKGTRVMILK